MGRRVGMLFLTFYYPIYHFHRYVVHPPRHLRPNMEKVKVQSHVLFCPAPKSSLGGSVSASSSRGRIHIRLRLRIQGQRQGDLEFHSLSSMLHGKERARNALGIPPQVSAMPRDPALAPAPNHIHGLNLSLTPDRTSSCTTPLIPRKIRMIL
jgi:hypothetical protein